MKVLLAHGAATASGDLNNLIRASGHEVTRCEDAPSAYEAYQRDKYSLVILDRNLPPDGGLVFCRNIRSDAAAGSPLILIATPDTEPSALEAILAAGADDYIPLALDPGETRARLAVAERRARQRAQHGAALEGLRKSEERYRRMVEDQQEFMALWNADGTLAFVNEAACRFFGKKRGALLGRGFLAFAPDEDYQMLRRHFASLTPERPVGSIEYKMRKKNGRPYWILCTHSVLFDSEGRLLGYQCVGRDISEQKRMEEELRYRLDFELLVTTLSKDFISLPPGEVDRGIEKGLKEIGQFAGVDRSYVFQYHGGGRRMSNTHEWCAEGIAPQSQKLQDLPVESFPYFTKSMRAGEVFHVPRVADLPPEAEAEKKEFLAEDIQSLICVPMYSGGTLFAFLGFDSVRAEKTWTADAITLLGIVGEIFVNALHRRRSEEALRESDERFRQLAENIEDVFYLLDLKARRALYVSPSYERLYGEARESVYRNADNWQRHLHPEDRERAAASYRRILAGEAPPAEVNEYRIVRPDGSVRWIRNRGFPVRDASGRIHRIAGISTDITEQKRAEDELANNEEKYRGLFESALDGIAVHREGRIIEANPALAAMFAYAPSELIGIHVLDLAAPRSRAMVERVMRQGSEQAYEAWGRKKDGSVFPGELRSRNISYEGRKARVTTIRDITEQKRVEEALGKYRRQLENLVEERTVKLRAANESLQDEIGERRRAEEQLMEYQQRLRNMAAELSLTEERQRRRIAADLHDQIGQSLVLSKIKLGVLRESLSAASPRAALDEIREILDKTIRDTRSLIFEISPPILYELGLEPAVEWLAERIGAEHGIACRVKSDHGGEPLKDETGVLLFMVVRELFMNVVKHSQASCARLSIRRGGGEIHIHVEDDGVGFDPSAAASRNSQPEGFGLFSIKERLDLLGGRLKIESAPKHGTRVSVSAPLKSKPGA